jgi:class 3 adenylate cyclase
MKRINTMKSDQIVLNAAEQNTRDMLSFAKSILKHSKSVKMPGTAPSQYTSLRVGMNTGPCLSGIVGTKRMNFCLLGESVNLAARLEQTGCPDMIHASDVVKSFSEMEPWEKKTNKNIKTQTQTYLLSYLLS